MPMDINRFSQTEWNQMYISSMRPVFRKGAVFTDTTENFVIPAEPTAYERIRIRFRTAKNNVDRVLWISGNEKEVMLKESSDDLFDYFYLEVQLENEKLRYHFEIQVGKVIFLYDVRGLVTEANEYYDFVVIPGFKTPDWAKGAVMYQIYTDRFCNGDKSNDVESREYFYVGDYSEKVENWNENPASMDVRRFYGGDLQGVLDKMDYLQELGIDVIYFNPLFVSPSNHKYDIQDYDYIDPHFGKIVEEQGELLQDGETQNRLAEKYVNRVTNKQNLEASNALFAKVVEEAHKRGIKVILDGVFNHCGSFNKWMDRERIYENADGYEKGAYVDASSPYHNYFQFFDQNQWPYNGAYDGWWGHDTLPKLNYEGSGQLYEYILYIARKWVSPPYNADGWRLDVAADLGHSPEFNHQFWKAFRRAVKQANPNAIILAEHYGNPISWLQGDEWDTVMNYDAFMEPLTWFLTGMEKHSDDFRMDMLGNAQNFWGAMRHHQASFAMPSLLISMNELSNHDHSRFLTRTNHKVGRVSNLGAQAASEGVNKAVMREAVVVQMTWIGAPTIYYGDEVGVCGFTDPDNRRTYPWGQEDLEMVDFHKNMIRIHKNCQELKQGSLKYVDSDYNFLAYGRFDAKAVTLVLINNQENVLEKEISVWELGVPRETVMISQIYSDETGFQTEPKEHIVVAGKLDIRLPKTSALVLRYEVPDINDEEPEDTAEPDSTAQEKKKTGFWGWGLK